MTRIALKEVSKSYNGVKAVNSLSLEVQDGEFLVMLGPPGAGKSSTIKMIAGVEAATTGEIYFDNNPMGSLPPNKRNVAMVFESYALYPHLTAHDNIAYPLQAKRRESGYSAQQIEARVNKVTELLRITEQLSRRPAFLSGGQRQRVALARALVREPAAFLMDEPIAHLDARLRHYLRGELKRQHYEARTTTIWCTPDYLEAIAMGDRIAVMCQGNLRQVATPAEILAHPASVEVAQFIGDPPMNILTAEPFRDDGQLWLKIAESRQLAPDRIGNVIAAKGGEGNVLLGIRPNDIVVHRVEGAPQCLPTRLYAAETLHRKTVLSLSFGPDLIKANVQVDFQGKVGDAMWVNLNLEKAVVFDAKTGLALTC